MLLITYSAVQGDRHPLLAFFDILHLNGLSLLKTPYEERRAMLEQTVGRLEGFVGISRQQIDRYGD